jgi:hypothetical protein
MEVKIMFEIMGRKYASVTCADVVLYDLVCGNPVAKFDTLKLSSIEQTADTNDVQGGKGNPVLARIASNKQVNLSIQDAVMSMTYLAVVTGGEVVTSGENTAIRVAYNEKVKAEDTGLTLTHAMPAGTTLWLAEVKDGIISERKARFDVAEGEASVQTIALDDENWRPSDYEVEAGKEYQVFYSYDITTADQAKELTVFSDVFAKTYRLVGDTELYNTYTGRNDALQIEVPRFALDSNYTFELNADGTAAVFDMNGAALADDEKRLIIYRIYNGEEVGEATECIEGASL